MHSWTSDHLQMTCETWHSVNAKHRAVASIPFRGADKKCAGLTFVVTVFINLTQARTSIGENAPDGLPCKQVCGNIFLTND